MDDQEKTSALTFERLEIILDAMRARSARSSFPPSLKAMFEQAATGRGVRDREGFFFGILPLSAEAFSAFAASLSPYQKAKMFILAHMLGHRGEASAFAAGIGEGAETEKMLANALRGVMKQGAGVPFDTLVTQAYNAMFEHFTVEDYKKLNRQQQTALAYYFNGHEYDHGKLWQKAQRRLIQALEIPEDLRKVHEEKLELLKREIITSRSSAAVYDFLDKNENLRHSSYDERSTIAWKHIRNMARIYQVGMPHVGVIDLPPEKAQDGQEFATYMMMKTAREGDVCKPSILLNTAIPRKGFNETYGFDFIETLSHEFAHYLETIMTHAMPGSRIRVETPDGWSSDELRRKGSSFLRDPAIAVPITINSDEVHLGDSWKRYVQGTEDAKIYEEQIKERHARWLGRETMCAVLDALDARAKLLDLQKYRASVLRTLKWIGERLAPDWPPHEELRRLIETERAAFEALDTDDRAVLVCAGSNLLLKAYALAEEIYEREKDIPDVPGTLSYVARMNYSHRQEANLLLKGALEWLSAPVMDSRPRPYSAGQPSHPRFG